MGTASGQWITEEDIGPKNLERLTRLWRKREDLADGSPSIDCFRNWERIEVWYSACKCSDCMRLVDQLEVVQAEFIVVLKSVALEIGAEDSGWSPGWRRVAACFGAYIEEEREARREMYRAVRAELEKAHADRLEAEQKSAPRKVSAAQKRIAS